MPHGHLKTVWEGYMQIKLQKDAYCLWAERKVILQLKRDDELVYFAWCLRSANAIVKQWHGLQDMGSLNSNNQGNVSLEFNGITCTGMDAEQGRQVPVEMGTTALQLGIIHKADYSTQIAVKMINRSHYS